MRRKAQDRHLAVRAKSLVKKWRELLLPPTQNKTPPIPTIGEPPPGGGHGGMNGGSRPLVNGNGAAVNQSSYNRPSSRLTSPATNAVQGHNPNNKSTLSPGLRTGVSSSLPSSTSTSPGLSRPTTPINKHSPLPNSSHPASPTLLPVHQQTGLYGGESVPRHNAANKRLRKEMGHEELNHESKTSLFDVTDGRVDNGSSSSSSKHHPPPAKRSRPNGLVSNSTSNQNTSEFLLHHNNKEHIAHIVNSNSLSSPPLLHNCDNHSAKTAAVIIPPSNRFTSGNNVPPPDSSQISTPSVSPQGSSLSPPTVNTAVMDNNSSVKPPPGKRKTRSQRRSEDEPRDDILKQQMQSATRSGVLSKVRTTQELVEELTHSRLSSPSLQINSKPSQIINVVTDVTQLNETKTELMNRFFDSQNHSENTTIATTDTVLSPPDSEEAVSPSPDVLINSHSHRSSSSLSRSDSATPIDRRVGGINDPFIDNSSKETVEDVMARLPPIDTAAILAEIELEAQREAQKEQEHQDIEGLIPVKKPDVEVTDEMVNLLNDGHVESFNGNFGHDGEFKEWHQVVSKPSAEGDLLHILPYSVID